MAKLTYEEKKEIINLYNEERMGYGTIARMYHVGDSTIKYLIAKYNKHGESVLTKNKNRRISPKTKLEIVNRLNQGEVQNTIIVDYCVTATQIHNWIKKYEEFGYNGLIDKPKGRPPAMKKEKKTIDPNDKDELLRQKDQEILELKAEVEALKKLRALVLQRNKQQTKKKQ